MATTAGTVADLARDGCAGNLMVARSETVSV